MRNATVYGPSPALRLDIVVNDLCATAAATGRILLKSDGRAWRPQVHVEDVARSVRAVLEAPVESVHDHAFNVGRTEDNLRVVEIAELVSDAMPGGAPIEYVEDPGSDPRSYRVDFSKIAAVVPSFQPQVDTRRRRPPAVDGVPGGRDDGRRFPALSASTRDQAPHRRGHARRIADLGLTGLQPARLLRERIPVVPPHLPWCQAGFVDLVEHLLFLERVHAGPEPVVHIGTKS